MVSDIVLYFRLRNARKHSFLNVASPDVAQQPHRSRSINVKHGLEMLKHVWIVWKVKIDSDCFNNSHNPRKDGKLPRCCESGLKFPNPNNRKSWCLSHYIFEFKITETHMHTPMSWQSRFKLQDIWMTHHTMNFPAWCGHSVAQNALQNTLLSDKF